MPSYQQHHGPTVAEREAELIALQSAFDEYIASSRELEEELDAELAKMQEKLAESQSANAALSAQLENISPQLTSLESALTSSRQKLKEEQKLRRAAEQAQDEADQRLREMEQSLQTLREECDDVHEELAFKENELEETRLELEVEKQQLENELEKLRMELASGSTARQVSVNVTSNEQQPVVTDLSASVAAEANDEYVKKLEEELELVTEQLIDTEKRLNEAEAELQNKENTIASLRSEGRREEDQDTIRNLQSENADLMDAEQKLRDEITYLQEELQLSKEEISLQQEELQAAEFDLKQTRDELEVERVRHKEAITQLNIQLKEAEISSKNTMGEAATMITTVQAATTENEQLKEQIAALENALSNAKNDYRNVCDELDQVNARFDEAREFAKKEGMEEAAEELKASMKSDADHEIKKVKEDLQRLSEENKQLQMKVDESEVALAAFRDNKDNKSGDGANSEVVKQLQLQLDRAKKDLEKKEKEMGALSNNLNERLEKAEHDASRLETELGAVKGKLAESEAHLIVLRREKENAEAYIPNSPLRKQVSMRHVDGAPAAPDLGDRGRSRDVDQADGTDRSQSPSRARSTSPSSVMRLEFKLAEEAKKYKELEKQFNELQDQKRIGEVRIKRLEEDIKTLQRQVLAQSGDAAVVTQMTRLSSLASSAEKGGLDLITDDDIAGTRVDSIIESRDHKKMAEELKSLEKKCNSQREYNAQLLSKMLHLQGNIQVYCRIRPMSITEIQQGSKSVVESLSETEVGCFDQRTNKWKSFAFDRVWGPDQSQRSVFQDVEPLALSVVDGFNACIFAYGQTGSGKTYTMEGSKEAGQYGISYRTIQKIFHLLKLRAQQQRTAEILVGVDTDSPERVAFQYSLRVGMLEIYNDEIYDLLTASGSSMKEKKEESLKAGGKASLEIRRSTEGRIEVPNLTKEEVDSIEEVMKLLEKGNSNRATAATDMNEHSSRSHMVLIVDVTSGMGEANQNTGTLFLVDLAGSERVRRSNVDGEHLKEAGHINKSLAALGNVMEALDRKASHIPYRDSKLTYLLQDSLGGNSRTMMVVATSPQDASYDETIHALQFATRVRRIQIGAAQRNVTSKNLEETVKTLTEEMRTLTKAKERTELQLNSLKRDNSRVQEKLENLAKAKKENKTENKTLDVLKKNNDDMAARWQKEKNAREEIAEELEKQRKECRTLQQQIGKFKSKVELLEQKLEDKERTLEQAQTQLRQERNQVTASNVRARRSEVMRQPATVAVAKPKPASPSTPAISAAVSPTARSKIAAANPSDAVSSAAPAVVDELSRDVESQPSSADTDVAMIRDQVLQLLEKHDQSKVDRIDIIMDKFKGKESLLLEKMTQRYEGTAAPNTSASSNASLGSSIQQRNAMALQRHQERMKKIHEKKTKNGA